MRIYGRNALSWEGNDLLLEDRRLSAIFQKDDNPDLWHVMFPDGVLSADYYNKQRAKEHAMKIALKELNGIDEETGCGVPSSEFK